MSDILGQSKGILTEILRAVAATPTHADAITKPRPETPTDHEQSSRTPQKRNWIDTALALAIVAMVVAAAFASSPSPASAATIRWATTAITLSAANASGT
jgi:hypothetical protein